MASHAPWWIGLTVDHLYEQCPGRLRGLDELRRYGWDKQGVGDVDPLGTDICGWCRRVWIARNPQPAAPAVVTVDAKPCCEYHNEHCEPPSELCCYGCPEAGHPDHPIGARCVLDRAVAGATPTTTTREISR